MPVSRAVRVAIWICFGLFAGGLVPAMPRSGAQPVVKPAVMPAPDMLPASLAPHDLWRQLTGPVPPVVVDVREAVEFDVSHVPGAARLPPKLAPEAAVGFVLDRARGRRVVLYCTAAFRSQLLADTIYHDLMEAGVTSVEVLSGGIIAWANADLPLVDAKGLTRLVHTYDTEMARLLADPARGRQQPAP